MRSSVVLVSSLLRYESLSRRAVENERGVRCASNVMIMCYYLLAIAGHSPRAVHATFSCSLLFCRPSLLFEDF